MDGERIVVGAAGDDDRARRSARCLRDAGHEVVFVGGGQSAEHLARTAVAEDAGRVVVDADDAAIAGLVEALRAAGVHDVAVMTCDQSDARHDCVNR